MLDFFLSKGKNCYLVGIKTFKPSQSPSCCFLQQSVIRRKISFHKILVGIKTLKPSQSPSYCFLQQSIIRRKISFHKMPKITSLILTPSAIPLYIYLGTQKKSQMVCFIVHHHHTKIYLKSPEKERKYLLTGIFLVLAYLYY